MQGWTRHVCFNPVSSPVQCKPCVVIVPPLLFYSPQMYSTCLWVWDNPSCVESDISEPAQEEETCLPRAFPSAISIKSPASVEMNQIRADKSVIYFYNWMFRRRRMFTVRSEGLLCTLYFDKQRIRDQTDVFEFVHKYSPYLNFSILL